MTILEKLQTIQTTLKAPKNLWNSFGKYKYRNAESIQEALKPLLDDTRTALTIEDEIVPVGHRFYVKATCRLYDLDTDEQVIITAYAREAEEKAGMDPAQITGAASSYARKYALNGMFLLDDTKDPDTDELKIEADAKAEKQKKQPDPKSSVGEEMKKELIQLTFKAGVETKTICEQAGVKDLKDIDAKTFGQIKAALLKKINDGDKGTA